MKHIRSFYIIPALHKPRNPQAIIHTVLNWKTYGKFQKTIV